MAMLLTIFSIAVVYLVAKIIYQLYLHPLSKFPGPKAAALTGLYEAYFQWSHEGTFPLVLEKLHAKYGDFVRIAPDEVHVADPECYDTIFNFNPEIDKFNSLGVRNPSAGGLFGQSVVEDSKLQRRPYDAPFSRPAVVKKEKLIREKMKTITDVLDKAYETNEVVDITSYYRALTTDIIASFSFGRDMDLLHNPDKAERLYAVWRAQWKRIARFQVLPLRNKTQWALWFVRWMPSSGQSKGDPEDIRSYEEYQKEMKTYINDTLNAIKQSSNSNNIAETSGSLPAFQEALGSKHASAVHFEPANLHPNGDVVFLAGSETTASAMGTGAFHILSNPSILRRLQADLDNAWSTGPPSWTDLERIPLLKGIVMESLRLDLGVSRRFVRTNAKSDMRLRDDVIIPRGFSMSMSHRFMFFNPNIFPDPQRFDPDRWTQSEEETMRLSKFMHPFSRGTRQCLAYSIAQAELYLVFAEVHRQFDLQLVGTKREDVDCTVDRVLSFPKAGKMTVKVEVLKRRGS